MVVLTAPFIMLPSTSKVFWTALKTMWYPSIYPATLIIIMQLTAAMSSWIGTIGANISGMAIMFDAIPLLLGIVSIFMLPKIVKVMLTGGNVFLAQMAGMKTAAMVAIAAATGGAGLAMLGGKIAAGAAAKGGAAAAAGGGGGRRRWSGIWRWSWIRRRAIYADSESNGWEWTICGIRRRRV